MRTVDPLRRVNWLCRLSYVGGGGVRADRVRELGLAWESVDDAAVEDRAVELATRVAADPELARVAVGKFRREVVNGAVPWDVAMQSERPAQMWSMRRQRTDAV